MRCHEPTNPVLESAAFAMQTVNLVQIDEAGSTAAAKFIYDRMKSSSYSPRTWRTHPLHICPPEPYVDTPESRKVLDWIFLISSLNFSFWSDKGEDGRYGVEWWTSWARTERKVWTGYWSLVAALDRALEEGIPITDPTFYADEYLCPDETIRYIFRAAGPQREEVPLLKERIEILRDNGSILNAKFNGSFKGFLDKFHESCGGHGSALDLVMMVIEYFPSFRDEVEFNGRRVQIWKRAQILVAEIWAAFYPEYSSQHPLFPGPNGPCIHHLTMFADYRVPQVLAHLRIISYSPALMRLLEDGKLLPYGSLEEISLRVASIVAVEKLRQEILSMQESDGYAGVPVSSVIIDFYLWDLAKRIESGEEKVDGIETADVHIVHRTRSIWY